MSTRDKISIMRPLLPQTAYIVPYLKQIDENRWYSNFGPLARGLEDRLAEYLHVPQGGIVTVANGTAGLTNTLRALNFPANTYCLLPSWTFVATPAAVNASGLLPYFIDVDEKTWSLTPENVRKQLNQIDGNVSAVIVVAPFGSPIATKEWDVFTEDTGIPVIIDAAAAFDSISSIERSKPSETPIIISLHATKIFSSGEGGLVISSNTNLVKRVEEMSNFGFAGSRVITTPGTNGKMSEYAAAVGHAALDLWPQTRELWICLKEHYAKAFSHVAHKTDTQLWLDEEWASSTFNIRLPEDNAQPVIDALSDRGIESRQWWQQGCHAQPAYSNFPRLKLAVTEALGRSVIALPFTLDIDKEDVDYIVKSLDNIITDRSAA